MVVNKFCQYFKNLRSYLKYVLLGIYLINVIFLNNDIKIIIIYKIIK